MSASGSKRAPRNTVKGRNRQGKSVEDLFLRTVESRLARYLLQTASGDVLQRQRWPTRAEMAARFGTVPDVLNRAFRALAEEGLIRLDRHQITILDRGELQMWAGIEA